MVLLQPQYHRVALNTNGILAATNMVMRQIDIGTDLVAAPNRVAAKTRLTTIQIKITREDGVKAVEKCMCAAIVAAEAYN